MSGRTRSVAKTGSAVTGGGYRDAGARHRAGVVANGMGSMDKRPCSVARDTKHELCIRDNYNMWQRANSRTPGVGQEARPGYLSRGAINRRPAG
jgi:hypothetical protein